MSDLLEYSVVYSDRSLNHMSPVFQQVMRDVSNTLKRTYNTDAAVIVPGSGTFAMEAIARQLAVGKKCLVIRNGWFSYRWSQIFEMGKIPSESIILTAQRVDDTKQPAFKPPALEDVIKTIKTEKPDLVFAPHVETSAGMILPDDYICTVSEAVHSVGGLLVLDCIASGTTWIDMEAVGVDILVSAPQKGWSAVPCAGLVMLNATSRERVMSTTSNSFACDLRKWLEIMEVYEQGKHAYHATMPTDGLKILRDTMKEMCAFGFSNARLAQQQLGKQIRALLENQGFKSVASEGFQADSVIVSYTDDKNIHTGKKFLDVGVQIAAGVPLKCGEPEDFQTFRIGLFGLDKLKNIETTVNNFKDALTKIKK